MANKPKTAVKNKTNLAEQIAALADPIVCANGCELIDVEYQKEGGEYYLRLFIDRDDQPIDHTACQAVSEAVSAMLDEEDPIPTSYYLEVSSPGVERPLKKAADFDRFKGQRVRLTLYAPLNGKKEYSGELLGLQDGEIALADAKDVITIPYDKVAKACLAVFS